MLRTIIEIADVSAAIPGHCADDEPRMCGRLCGGFDHQWNSKVGRCEVRFHFALEHRIPKAEWCVPEIRCDGASALITSPGVVDEDIEPPSLGANALKESFNVTLIQMVATHRNAFATAPVHFVSRVLNCSRQAIRRWLAANAATGYVDRRATLTENSSNGATRAAPCASHHGKPCRPARFYCVPFFAFAWSFQSGSVHHGSKQS
jgi:hypothetical protein